MRNYIINRPSFKEDMLILKKCHEIKRVQITPKTILVDLFLGADTQAGMYFTEELMLVPM